MKQTFVAAIVTVTSSQNFPYPHNLSSPDEYLTCCDLHSSRRSDAVPVGNVFLPRDTISAGESRIVIVVADHQAQTRWVDIFVAPKQQSAEDGFGHNVEDAVEDGLRVGRDDVAALREPPGDWVEEPEEDGPDAADEVGAVDVGAESEGVFTRGPGYGPGDPEEGKAAEDEVAPLLGERLAVGYG